MIAALQTALAAKLLQLGREFSLAEICTVQSGRRGGVRASIGPGIFTRGNVPEFLQAAAECAASIGPRIFTRGNMHVPVLAVCCLRSFNWAANFHSRKSLSLPFYPSVLSLKWLYNSEPWPGSSRQ